MSKDDSEAFLFTLKNPHGISPTQLMKRKESQSAISCYPRYGPQFGNDDLLIPDHCDKKNSCSINNNGKYGFECDLIKKCCLFVNTNLPEEINYFTVLDYEVYALD